MKTRRRAPILTAYASLAVLGAMVATTSCAKDHRGDDLTVLPAAPPAPDLDDREVDEEDQWSDDQDYEGKRDTQATVTAAETMIVSLRPVGTERARGTAMLTDEPGGVRVSIEVEGARPGTHGLRIHDDAECSSAVDLSDDAPATTSASELGELVVASDGRGTTEFTVTDASLNDGAHPLAGRALVLHAKADTAMTDGDEGPRVACAPIAL